MPNPCHLAPLDPSQLVRARIQIAWWMLVPLAERLDLMPLAARSHVADALSELALAKAVMEETTTSLEKEHLHDC